MKKAVVLLVVLMMVAAFALTGCGSGEFKCDASDEKNVVITADKAAKDSFFLSGSLEVGEDEMIVVEPSLGKGTVTIGLIRDLEEQSIDDVPDTDAKPAYEFDISGDEVKTIKAPSKGSYSIKATVKEKATGTITIKAK